MVLWRIAKRQRFWNAAGYLVLGSSGFVAWNGYVALVREGVQQVYQANPFLTGWWGNIMNYSDVISTWFLPTVLPLAIRILLLVVVFLLSIIYQKRLLRNRVVLVLSYQSFFYITTMIVLLSVDYDEIERLLAIVYPWVIGALFILMDHVYQVLGGRTKRILLVGLLAWMSYVAVRGGHNSLRWHRDRCEKQLTGYLQAVDDYAIE